MKFAIRLLAPAALTLFVNLTAHADDARWAKVRFKVTLLNTTADNAISPFAIALLKPGASLFELGQVASEGISQIAETGNTAKFESELNRNPAKLGFAKPEGGPILAGESRSVEFEVSSPAFRQAGFNLIAMIGRSNDSFVALRSIALNSFATGQRKTYGASNYDAGSEENTGNVEDFGPGGHPIQSAEGHVSADRGLNPRGNAPETYAWGSLAARVTIERIR